MTGTHAALQRASGGGALGFLEKKVTFDIQERLRWEIRDDNFDFNDAANAFTDDNWFLQRFRLGVMIRPASWLKVYAQGQDSREIDSDRVDFPGALGAEGDDSFDLRQGYVEIGDAGKIPLTLKLGRQILSYGDERLIGAFDWNNIGRTFDAAKLRWEEEGWWLDAFASSVVVPTRGQFNHSDLWNGNETDRGQVFSGLYFSTTALRFQTTDLYALHLYENSNSRFIPTATGDSSFVTLGLRIKSAPGAFSLEPPAPAFDGKAVAESKATLPSPAAKKHVGFDYDAEFAFQTGEVRGLDLTAWAVHGGVGYTFNVPWLPRLCVAYNHASGGDPLDGDIETFQNLFPTNHKFYGQMDVLSWQNMQDLEFSVSAQPVLGLTLKAEYHAFWLASTKDIWYRANGSTAVRPLGAAARNADSYAGSEIDFIVQWAVTNGVALEAGYSRFFAGDYLAATGSSDHADFGYVQATVTF